MVGDKVGKRKGERQGGLLGEGSVLHLTLPLPPEGQKGHTNAGQHCSISLWWGHNPLKGYLHSKDNFS